MSSKSHVGIQMEALRKPKRSPGVTAGIRTKDRSHTTCANHYTKAQQQHNAVSSVLVAADRFETEEKWIFVTELAVRLLLFCRSGSQSAL